MSLSVVATGSAAGRQWFVTRGRGRGRAALPSSRLLAPSSWLVVSGFWLSHLLMYLLCDSNKEHTHFAVVFFLAHPTFTPLQDASFYAVGPLLRAASQQITSLNFLAWLVCHA